MASIETVDIYVGLGAIVIAAAAIYFFMRASSGKSKSENDGSKGVEKDIIPSLPETSIINEKSMSNQNYNNYLKTSEVETARSNVRTLTMQSELLSMILKRLFEAEDDGEISREERLNLSKGYEEDLKKISEKLKHSELILTLYELEKIREDILNRFNKTLESTQSRIDSIVKELEIEKRKREPPKRSRIKKTQKEEISDETEKTEEETKEPKVKKPEPKSEVETKLEQLREEVLKELEELDKLELEA
jgi:hypothetical protein